VWVGLLASAEKQIATQWTGEMWLSCREVQCEALGFYVPWRNRACGATCRIASFLPLSRKLAFSLLMEEQGLSWCQGQWGVLGLCAL
jgi:hypothetical protein